MNILRKLKINEILGKDSEYSLVETFLLSLFDLYYSNVVKVAHIDENIEQNISQRIHFYSYVDESTKDTFQILTSIYIKDKKLSSRGILKESNQNCLMNIDKKEYEEISIFLHKKFIKKYFNMDVDIEALY